MKGKLSSSLYSINLRKVIRLWNKRFSYLYVYANGTRSKFPVLDISMIINVNDFNLNYGA